MFLTKIEVKVIMLGINRIISFVWKSYKFIAFMLGTLILMNAIFWISYYYIIPAKQDDIFHLESGFYFTYDMHDSRVGSYRIADNNGKTIVSSDVKEFMQHEQTIYGYREALANEVYYFICSYGDDCTNSQNMTDIEFNKNLIEQGLPDFSKSKRQNYWSILEQQQKNDTQ